MLAKLQEQIGNWSQKLAWLGPLLARLTVGIVFAKSLDDESTGYALTTDESRAVMEAGPELSERVGTPVENLVSPDAVRQSRDCHFLRIPNIDDLPDRRRGIDQLDECPHDIGDVRERARLRPIAKDRDRFPRQRLLHEVRNHHAVLTGLTRSHGIEEPHDDDRELPFLPVREREKFVDRLAAGVGPPMLRRRPQYEIGILSKRHVLALAVDLRC